MFFVGPLAAFEENTVTVASAGWLGSHVLVLKIILNDEIEGESVNSDFVGSGVVLHSGGQESLREEES